MPNAHPQYSPQNSGGGPRRILNPGLRVRINRFTPCQRKWGRCARKSLRARAARSSSRGSDSYVVLMPPGVPPLQCCPARLRRHAHTCCWSWQMIQVEQLGWHARTNAAERMCRIQLWTLVAEGVEPSELSRSSTARRPVGAAVGPQPDSCQRAQRCPAMTQASRCR